MLLKIILAACFMPLPLIIYLILRNEAKPKKNIILGVTLPLHTRSDDAVGDIVRQYKTRQTTAFMALTLLAVPALFLTYDSVMMTWFFVWMIFVLIVPFILFMYSNKALKTLKQQNNWFGEAAGVELVDIKLALTPKQTLSVWLFLPPIVLSLIPVADALLSRGGSDPFWPLLGIYLMFAVLTIGFYFLYRIIFYQKAEVVDENTTVNAALTQVRRYNWGKFWLFVTWLNGLFSLVIWMFPENGLAIAIGSVAYSTVLLIFALAAEFKTRKIQQKLTADSGRSVYTDDDDHWLFGMLYNNPNDRHFIVNKRIGIGTTVNLAGPGGKILMVISLLIVLSMPLFGLWMMRMEFTPVTLSVTDTAIVAGHTGVVYDIPLDTVSDAYTLSVLPNGTRTMGTGMASVLKGHFHFDGIGPCLVCLDPRTPPFLVLTADGTTYILGASDAAQTQAVTQQLQARNMPVE